MGHNRRLWLGRRFLFPARAGPNTGLGRLQGGEGWSRLADSTGGRENEAVF